VAERAALFWMGNQAHPNLRQVIRRGYTHGIPALKQSNHFAKIFRVVADDDGNSVLSGLEDVVTTVWFEAAANEGDIRKGIE